jgi:hyperosmotically inducible protein
MNKNIVLIVVVSALAVLLSVSCTAKSNIGIGLNEGDIEQYRSNVAESENAEGRIEDARITSMVKMEFSKDELLSSTNINIDTTNGSVTLSGKVSNKRKADRAVEITRSIQGVRRVRSKLIVEE